MSKKHFIALADAIKASPVPFTSEHLEVLATFCASNAGGLPFKRERWLSYIAGQCGRNGGAK